MGSDCACCGDDFGGSEFDGRFWRASALSVSLALFSCAWIAAQSGRSSMCRNVARRVPEKGSAPLLNLCPGVAQRNSPVEHQRSRQGIRIDAEVPQPFELKSIR